MEVVIVGCGVFGLSTAIHMAEKHPDYKITALDAYPVPSAWSAANDINKIIRNEYTDLDYCRMSVEAYQLWKSSPVFKQHFSECGRVQITPLHHEGRRKFEMEGIETLRKVPGQGQKIELHKGGKALAERFPYFDYNSGTPEMEWKFNAECGLAHSANSLRAAHSRARDLGVRFVFGEAGRAVGMTHDPVEAVVCADGSKYTGDLIIIASGAGTGNVIDLKQQQSAVGLFVSHIRLTDSEFEKFKNIPIMFDAEMGYFFPPDPETRLLKIALPGSGTTNYNDQHKSLPRYKSEHPEDTMPRECVAQVKQILGKYVPELAYHDLVDSKCCWIADTADSHFIIDFVPGYKKVMVATGDSGHAFKLLPNIGKYIVAKADGDLAPHLAANWKWREDTKEFSQEECEWRVVSENLDFKDITTWVKEEPSSKRLSKL